MGDVMRLQSFLLLLLLACSVVQAEDSRIAQELADNSPPINPLREAMGKKAYDEAMASGKYRYVGPRSCRVCHRDFFNGRKDDKHFHTFNKIKNAGFDKEPKCLACHTTGYGVPTGFVDEKKSTRLLGVQCEGCHGPGNVHMRLNDGGGFLAGVDNPARIRKMCQACHSKRWNRSYTPEQFQQFYDSYVTATPGDEKPSYYSD
ncbi:MAG: cytochrome c family protein [Chromatiales bacterium]|nr:cytochrome c family protein [Chromatiales bacterium]